VPRNDPTDTGGLFIGRRPGTAPLKYRSDPNRDPKRQRADATLANALFVLIVVVVLTAWGPQPMAWLWVGSQVDYHTGSLMLGITVSFMGLLASLMVTLWITTQLDGAWRILRRASGREQKDGVLSRIWLYTAIFAGAAFIFWFLIIAGPGPSFAPSG
jgi:hypothetical protein